jgi:hypothetical protein
VETVWLAFRQAARCLATGDLRDARLAFSCPLAFALSLVTERYLCAGLRAMPATGSPSTVSCLCGFRWSSGSVATSENTLKTWKPSPLGGSSTPSVPYTGK